MQYDKLNPWKGLKGLPKDMWALFATTLINRSGTMVFPFLTLYLTRKIGVSPAEAGVVLMVYGIGAFITAPLMGRLSDKLGSLNIMKFSLFGTGIMFIVFSFAGNYSLILILSFLLSMVNEAFRPANLSMITEIAAPSQRRMAFALNRLAINIGMSVGPVIGGFLTLVDYNLLFYANAFTSLAAGFYLLRTRLQNMPEKNSAQVSENQEERASVLKDKAFLFFLAGIIPASLVFFQIMSTLPLYVVNDLKYSTAVFGLFAAINTVLIIFIEVPLNNVLGKVSYRNSLAIGGLFTAVGFGLTAFATETIMLSVSIIIWTFGEMIFFPASAAYTSEIAPFSRRGTYMGYYQMVFSLAFSLGPWLGTVIYQQFGPYLLWISTFFFALITSAAMKFIKSEPASSYAAGN